MPDASTLTVFVLASLALAITPGPAVLYITTRSVEGGRVAGLVSAAGISVGGLVQVAFATAGLSAVLASSATAFSVVKWAGAAYLVYLGLSRVFAKDERPQQTGESPTPRRSLSAIFLRGVLVNVLNPKPALFFLAFLPQFVHTSQGPAWTQTMVLGLVFVAAALSTDSLYALLGGTAGGWIRRRNQNGAFRRGQRYFTGGVYLALGAAAAATGRSRN